MAGIQDPHGDTECALQSLAQTSALPQQLTVSLRGQQHGDDFLRQQKGLCRAGLLPSSAWEIQIRSSDQGKHPITCHCPACGCRPWWLHSEEHLLLQGQSASRWRHTGWDQGSLAEFPNEAQGPPKKSHVHLGNLSFLRDLDPLSKPLNTEGKPKCSVVPLLIEQ